MTQKSERNLVHVVPYFPPHLGGMENVAQTLVEGLAPTGSVEVITSSTGASGEPRLKRRGNLAIRRLATLEVAHLPFMPTLLLHLLRLPRHAIVHVHIAQAYVPEVVWLAAVLRRWPFVAHYHLDVEPSGSLGFLFVLYKRWLLGVVLRGAARVIVLTDEQAAFVSERYRVAKTRIVVVPNGVDPGFKQSRASRSDHMGPFRLLFVGRLAPQKNVALLLQAVARLSEAVELVIVGDGEERAHLERLVSDLGLGSTRLVGAKRGAQLLEWYGWADAFVIASEREGMPLVVLEAMAAGLPVIGTEVPGLANTIGADGILARPEAEALAEAIERLIHDPELRCRLTRRSEERSREHSWASVIERLRCVYAAVGS